MDTLTYLYNQFIGSDTQGGSSPVYVWLADQFGHVFIGFGGLFALLWLMALLSGRAVPGHPSWSGGPADRPFLSNTAILIAASFILIAYVGKEIFYDLRLAGGANGTWLSAWSADLIGDIATDIAFVAIGLILALAHFGLVFRLHPTLVFAAMLAVTFFLVDRWVPTFKKLDKSSVPDLVRIADVTLLPAQPVGTVPDRAAESADVSPACRPFDGNGGVMECAAGGTCTKTHFVVYGLSNDQLSLSGSPTEPDKAVARAAFVQAKMLELRRLGSALVSEHVFRGGKGDALYSTLYAFVGEHTTPSGGSPLTDSNATGRAPSTLVLDNIERELMLHLQRPDLNDAGADKLPALANVFETSPQDITVALASKTVIWLSLKEGLASSLCDRLARDAGEGGKVILIHAKFPDEEKTQAARTTAAAR